MAEYIPQVDYTSRDYASIREDMISLIPNFAPDWSATDSTDFGVVLLEMFAYMGDTLNYYIDRAANENFIQSATQESTIRKLAKLFGYVPYTLSPSSTTAVLSNSGASAVTVLSGTLFSSGSDTEGNVIYFESTSDVSISAGATATVNLKQGQTIFSESVGTSNGTANQSFALSNEKVDIASIEASASTISYTRVDNLLYYGSTDKVFYADTDSDGITRIYFGDGTTGAIPPNGTSVFVNYRTCVGFSGNVPANAITTIESSGYDTITVLSSVAALGGTDSESVNSIRTNAPLFTRSGGRAVSISDYQNLALNVSGVAKSRAVSQYFTQVIIFILADNWATASTTLRQNVITALANKTPPSTTLQVVSGTLVYPQFDITVNALPSYNLSAVTAAVRAKLVQLFAFTNVYFGQRITKGNIFGFINRSTVEGLDYIVINGLAKQSTAPTAQLSSGTVTSTTDIFLAANEIPYLDPLNIVLISGTGI